MGGGGGGGGSARHEGRGGSMGDRRSVCPKESCLVLLSVVHRSFRRLDLLSFGSPFGRGSRERRR